MIGKIAPRGVPRSAPIVFAILFGCGRSPLDLPSALGETCGPGTHDDAGTCVADELVDSATTACGVGTYVDAGVCVPNAQPSADASARTCGPGTYEDAGICIPDPTRPSVIISPETIEFGLVDCATAAPPRGIALTNRGATSIDFTSTLARGAASPYTVYPATGTVAPNSSLGLVVAPAAIPSSSPVTPNLYGDTLTITTSGPTDVPHVIPLGETAHGAIITATAVAFGSRLIGVSTPLSSSWANSGNVDAHLLLSGPSPFSIATGAIDLTANGPAVSVPATFTSDPYSLGVPASHAISAVTATPLCAPLPSAGLTATPTDRATAVSTGSDSTCAIARSGFTYCWGNNNEGQLGDATVGIRSVPRPVPGIVGALQMASSRWGSHCAVLPDHSVACWGRFYQGAPSHAPIAVGSFSDVKAASVAFAGACALHQNGTVSCWGEGGYGQLGNGGFAGSASPTDVLNVTDATAIASSDVFSCALHSTGAVSCWGADDVGQLGDGGTTNSATPVVVQYVNDAVSISVGPLSACAVRRGGTAVCWGSAGNGQLGTNYGAPGTNVLNVTSAADTAVGLTASCARLAGGTVTCWGTSGWGETGDKITVPEPAPTASVYQLANAATISMTYQHACAVVSGGAPYLACWGRADQGQLGNGLSSPVQYDSPIPVAVTGFQ